MCHVCRCQVAAASLTAAAGEDSSGPPQLTDSSDDEETSDRELSDDDGDVDKAMSALHAHIHMHDKGSSGRTFTHRHKINHFHSPIMNACVARPVGKKEIAQEPKAKKAVDAEWQRLRDIHTWNEGAVREWQDVARECHRKGTKAHVGRLFNICVEKNSELAPELRKYKGRSKAIK